MFPHPPILIGVNFSVLTSITSKCIKNYAAVDCHVLKIDIAEQLKL